MSIVSLGWAIPLRSIGSWTLNATSLGYNSATQDCKARSVALLDTPRLTARNQEVPKKAHIRRLVKQHQTPEAQCLLAILSPTYQPAKCGIPVLADL